MKNHTLLISWGTSRGQDTYGYNICRLDDNQTGRRFKCMGGGYDMTGTVFGDWLESEYQQELRELVSTLELQPYGSTGTGTRVVKESLNPSFYGLFVRADGSVYLDGGCGISSMQRIANAIGFDIQWIGNRKGHTIGYTLTQRMREAA